MRAINQQVKDVLGIFVPLYTCMYRCKTITKVQRMIRLTVFRVLRSFSLNAILISNNWCHLWSSKVE